MLPSAAMIDASPLRLRPEIGELAALVGFIEEFAMEHGWTPADTMAFALAAEELFANTLNHSRPPATAVEFWLRVEDGAANAVYSDDGSPFDPTAAQDVDTTLPLEQRNIGGLGIHFIRRSMAIFTYRRDGQRNVIAFGRRLSGTPAK